MDDERRDEDGETPLEPADEGAGVMPPTPERDAAPDEVASETAPVDAAPPVPPPPPPPSSTAGPAAPPPPYLPGYAGQPGAAQPVGIPPHWVAQVPAPACRPRSVWTTILIVMGLALLAFILLGLFGRFASSLSDGGGFGLNQVGVIEIEGVIRDGGEGGLFAGPAGARAIMKQIRQARKDDTVKAVIILINSPGGSAAASHAIYEEILRLREKKKVVACMTDTAASGGYYVAAACDKIVAQGATLTGSIGVIFGGVGYYGLMQKLGLTDETITAGKYKDMGSGARPMTAEERALLSAMLEDVYGQFLTAVAKGRKMDMAKVRRVAQGRVYTGSQAHKLGLVDELGNFYDAVKLTATLAGIKGEPKLKRYGASRGLLSELTGAESSLSRLLRGRGYWNDMPLHGPMLLMPYGYRLEPVLEVRD